MMAVLCTALKYDHGNFSVNHFGAFLVQIAVAALLYFIRRKRQYQKLSTSSNTNQVIKPSSSSSTDLIPAGLVWERFREFIVQDQPS